MWTSQQLYRQVGFILDFHEPHGLSLMSEFCTNHWIPSSSIVTRKDGTSDIFLTLALRSKSQHLKCLVWLSEQNYPVTGIWRRYIMGKPIEMFVFKTEYCQCDLPLESLLVLHSWLLHQGQLVDDKAFHMLLLTAECLVALIHVSYLCQKSKRMARMFWNPYWPIFFANLDVWFHPSRIHVLLFYVGRRSPALFHHPQVQREPFCLQQAGQTSGKHAAAPGFWQGGLGVGCEVFGP